MTVMTKVKAMHIGMITAVRIMMMRRPYGLDAGCWLPYSSTQMVSLASHGRVDVGGRACMRQSCRPECSSSS